MFDAIRAALTDPRLLAAWGVLVTASLAVLTVDIRRNNEWLGDLMRYVWGFTVLYSGPFGLMGYWWAGRAQISRDTLWRRGVRSVSHCYSGCGAGEVVGVVIAAGLLALGTWGVAAVTFALAYVAGYALTVGPLVQEGVGLRTALLDAAYSETASITVMEVVAVGVDVLLAGEATIGEPLFWAALVVSLTCGLAAAYPVNVALVAAGIKQGMMDPREAAA